MEIGELTAAFTQLKAEMDARFTAVAGRFEDLERRIAAEGVTTRRHMDVVAEKIRSDLKLTMDKDDGATGDLVARLAATNLRDHVAIEQALADHEVRLNALEAGRPAR